MPRVRVSTTVDQDLLARARAAMSPSNDAAVLDAALGALLDRLRRVEIDIAYSKYDEIPPDTADDWGDLASFREAAAGS